MNDSSQLTEAPKEEMVADTPPASVLSIVALAFCFFSLPAIWLNIFSIFAGLAVLFAIIAIIRSHTRPESLTLLAYISILVSGSILSWNISSTTKYHNHFISQADQFARTWIDHIAKNEIEEALSLQVEYPNRLSPNSTKEDLRNFYNQTSPIPERKFSKSPLEMKKEFLSGGAGTNPKDNVIALIIGSIKDLNVVKTDGKVFFPKSKKGVLTVNLDYDVSVHSAAGYRSGTIRVTMERKNYVEGPQWRIKGWDNGKSK